MAARAFDPKRKAELLEQEARWLKLAMGYEFSERLNTFSAKFGRQRRS